MNWQHFQTHNDAPTHAFETLCNQLFELWVNREYKDKKQSFVVVNGSGGDGGVEAYATLENGDEIGIQAKWFAESLKTSQLTQIKNSILTALEVHPKLIKYIVCIPRDLSNTKKGKADKIIDNSEHMKFENLKSDIANKYHTMDIELWGDYKLQQQLQCIEAAGVRRYWFDKEEISIEQLKYSFEMQKSGWLRQRYIPVLHNKGKIHDEIENFLGERKKCVQILDELKFIQKLYSDFLIQANTLNELITTQSRCVKMQSDLLELCSEIELQLKNISIITRDFIYESKLTKYMEIALNFKKIEEILDWLDKNSHGDYYRHYSDVKGILQKIYKINMEEIYQKLKQRINYNKMVVIGAPGTGKTHGIVNEVELQLEKNYHIPLLIQARTINPQDEWKDILIRALGISQVWNEDEIWTALEAFSYSNEANNPFVYDNEQNVRIIPKILICIDGLDEIEPYSRWSERISQVEIIVRNHPRIRFCFTGREYAFVDKSILNEKNNKKVLLSDDGDVPVRNIFKAYIEYYNVNMEGAEWLKYSINTPYALKLFCELYENKVVKFLGKSNVTATNLLEQKISQLDEEFKNIYGFDMYEKENLVKSFLLEINCAFEKNSELSDVQLKSVLRNKNIYKYLGEAGMSQLLNFFEKHTFLQSYKKSSSSFFEINEIIYLIGQQQNYDYLKALFQFEKSEYSNELIIDDNFLYYQGALQMYSIMILEKYGEIIWNNKACRDYYDSYELFKITAFSLINVSLNISGKHLNWVRSFMEMNADTLSEVVNHIILPLARTPKHPLGSVLLNEFLKSFDKSAIRDIIWSVPVELSGEENSVWVKYTEIEYKNDAYKLGIEDNSDGLPIIWAWGLTSVCNEKRSMIRKEIAKWGIEVPVEFYKLFIEFSENNDEQVRMDIFAIAMVISHICRKKHDFLRLISSWIIRNIFQYKNIGKNCNAAIRYYARAIVECAFSEGIVTNLQVEKCRPPYRINNDMLHFAKEATSGSRMDGYKMVSYDLSRYVLCDPINRMFLNNVKVDKNISKLLNEYKNRYKLSELTTEKFILGSAYGYILATGWNDEVFYGEPNGGKQGEKLGIDIAINRTYSSATHGSMSNIMTFTEKYAWCAKMVLLGYLADRILFKDEEEYIYVNDYGKIEDFVNPFQELCQIDLNKEMEQTEWIIPEALSPSMPQYKCNPDGIKNWINKSLNPIFSKWIDISDGEITIYGTHCVENEAQGVETMMWISSCIVKKGKIPTLIASLKEKKFAYNIINPNDIKAYSDAGCYITPVEICWFDWKKECESNIEFRNNLLQKNILGCTCNMLGYGDISFEMPSRNIRNIMGIVSGDGYSYVNKDGLKVMRYVNAGERWGDSQSILLANKKILSEKVLELDSQLIWIIRVLKEVSIKAREKYKDFFTEKDETYLVWKNSKGWQERRMFFDKNY